MQPILSAENVKYLDILSYPPINIAPNTATFITGESGSGKSTLLRLFNATLSPSAGVIKYNGQSIEDMDTVDLRRQVLLVGQSVFLFDKTIAENFAEYYKYRGQAPPSEETMLKCLSTCRADFALSASCTTLSGGERQRVYTAIFLSFAPRVLMLDEPTSALDTENAAAVLGNIKKHCKETGTTLVVVSHDNALTQQFAEETIFLKGGIMA